MNETNKILIVDDEPGIRQFLIYILGAKGYQAVAAGSGHEAMDLLERDTFMLALVDIELPDIEGLGLMRKLKAKAPELACCIMTGYGTMERAIEAIKAGADDFFVKPINMEQLLHRVEEVCEKQRMQQELIEAHLFTKGVLNSIRDAICIIDVSSLKIVEVNDAFVGNCGLTRETIIGRTCHEVIHNLPARCEAPCVCPLGSQEILERPATVEHIHFNEEGQMRYVEITAFPMRKNPAEKRLIVHTARDITDRKMVEQEITVKNMELKKAFDDLKCAQAQIIQQEKLATIGQLAAGVAHEVNNPIGFITSNLGSMGKYMDRITDFIEKQTEIVESCGESEKIAELKALKKKLKLDFIIEDTRDLLRESLDGADRVKKIVQNLKSFSRSDEQEHKYIDIHECIESAISIAWNELKYKCTVEKDYGELAPVLCYPHQLNQVIMNILVNGAHAIKDQGVIAIKTWEDEQAAFFLIADTGCGIPEENLAKIFEPFFTTKESGKGTGLGMSIASDIIKKHNGEITVQSEVGKGTTFTVRLPRAESRSKEKDSVLQKND